MSEAYDSATGEPEPSTIRVNAIWDTGATGSVINQEVISALGLQPIDKQKIYTANGERIAGVYLVNIHLANGVIFPGLRVSD
ncbi:MAG: retroviral-like aspartic protease family protein, partial [Nitrospinae bacterium]|nr:retroviral-like aspartic protease family protein [Nitrospinota bacterium]